MQVLQLALELHQRGRLEEAEAVYRQILGHDASCVGALNNLATLLHGRGRFDEAIACYQRALVSQPDSAQVLFNLGHALRCAGRLDEAMAALERAAELNPNDAATHNQLGLALAAKNQIGPATARYRRALALNPSYPDALLNLGTALTMLDELDEAIDSLQAALALQPDCAEVHYALGHALKKAGYIEPAIAHYRQAIAIRPDFRAAHGYLLYSLYLDPQYTPQQILAEHRQWERQHAAAWIGKPMRHDNDPSPDRRLRIGYVSPDFCRHVISRFLPSVMQNHDRTQFEIVCFSGVVNEDDYTRRFQAGADEWHSVARLSDDELAQLIQCSKIDILVDLSLHLADNRLMVFARKPAPIQVSCLAYPGTTGLSAMDYRFTDKYLDPPGSDDKYSERSLRLRSYWCYKPWEGAPDVAPPPSQSTGFITFGSLNYFAKVSDAALRTWAKLLARVPQSRLLIHVLPGRHRHRVIGAMTAVGVDPARVEFVGRLGFADYYKTYNRIDVALDCFPCSGGTTTCDALWMGVPVVTLAGATAVGRGGVSLLSQVNQPDLIAQSEEQYLATAAALAGDIPRLTTLRPMLRQRMAASPAFDGQNVARDVEEQYRWMWRQWCAARTTGTR